LELVKAKEKNCEIRALYQSNRNASLEMICAQVQHLKPEKTTDLRRYLPSKLVIAKVQLLEKR
jgi:hypothetical protein